MGEGRVNFCKVSDSYQMFHSETIRFKEYACLLKPCKEVIVITLKFNVAKASITQHMATNTHMHLVLLINLCGRDNEKFLKCSFVSW